MEGCLAHSRSGRNGPRSRKIKITIGWEVSKETKKEENLGGNASRGYNIALELGIFFGSLGSSWGLRI